MWVAWTDDDEQDGWYVPAQATIDLAEGALASGFYTANLGLELIGRPRTHRPAALTRVRDLRLPTEPKDTLGRLYGAAFDGTSGNGSSVVPAPLVWLPSDTQDVVIAGPGSPSYGPTRQGRGGASMTSVQGAGDLSVIHFEQGSAHRLRGDVVLYDRRGEAGTGWDAVNPHPDWEEVYGADWPWSGRIALENSLCRIIETDDAVLSWAYWDGVQYVHVADLRPRIDGIPIDTILSRSVVEWAPDRAVVRLVGHVAATPGTRTEALVTLQRGWLGPRIEVYTPAAIWAAVGILPAGGVSANNVPFTFVAAVNSGSITSPNHGITVAVIDPSVASTSIPGGVEIAMPGVAAVRVERCPVADVSAAHPALGADTLAATQYPQTIVAR